MTTLKDLLEHAKASYDPKTKGNFFERLIRFFLRNDPRYRNRLSDVWLWDEFPYRWGADTGIDLVAREADTGEFWAIQCKFYGDDHKVQKADIDSFLSASGKTFETEDGPKSFALRVVVLAAGGLSKHAEETLAGQTIPAITIKPSDLEESAIDWAQFDIERETAPLRPKKTPRPDQAEAISAVLEGFREHNRGKLIMACGTGKTFVSLQIMERLVPQGGRVLFLAPSIGLVSQTLNEWAAQTGEPMSAFVVCSDTKVGKDEEDMRVQDLAYPATTDAVRLKAAIGQVNLKHPERRTVIFSTYQSIGVIEELHRQGLGAFDLIVCDEAHRTTGLTLPGEDPSDFVKVHDEGIIHGKKRLYMTATPRIYADSSKGKASQVNAVLYSMDDPETYGPEFFRLGFGKAVELGILTEYKVLIVAVDEERMADLANTYNEAYQLDEKTGIDIRFATKVIGSWKGLSKQGLRLVDEDGPEEGEASSLVDDRPMRRAVAFNRSIQASRTITEVFRKIVDLYRQKHGDDERMVTPELRHVDGSMNALMREQALRWLKEDAGDGVCRILSNARCLSEGIDVPALDGIVFFDTRESIVDIVQSVGRVMRKAPGKQYGYIILPVAMPLSKAREFDSYVDSDPQFKGIWKVIKALRAHDETLVDKAEFRRKIKVLGEGRGGGGEQDEIQFKFQELPVDELAESVYAILPGKLGDREYWADWARNVAKIAQNIIARIEALIAENPESRQAFDRFLDDLRRLINPSLTREAAIEMLAQHVITRPVFEAVFEGYDFTQANPVSKAMQQVLERIDRRSMETETGELSRFYDSVRERVRLAKSDESRQEVIKHLYETFFKEGFKRLSERLGIVYTPVEIVDFILRSADAALRKHLGKTLSEAGVDILDPFTGTGTFPVRLLQLGLIEQKDLKRKFEEELHANEIVLLAYYIAGVNIESAYHALTGEYRPFPGIVLTDTFQMMEADQGHLESGFQELGERVERQKRRRIKVIIGNPPYSVNDNPVSYPKLDARIEATYAKYSTATLKISLYDSYIRAFRWATDRIGDEGVIAFVSNGGWLDGNAMDGFRACLEEEFAEIYVFNLRGNARTQGELRRMEAGNVFGEGSRTPVTITVLIKRRDHEGAAKIFYRDIGDYLSREEKLALIQQYASIEGVSWREIHPNEHHDWINQRSEGFGKLLPLNAEQDELAVFDGRSSGIKTNRDVWCYNYDRDALARNIRKHIDFYNQEVDRLASLMEHLASQKERERFAKENVKHDPKSIKWTADLIQNAARGRKWEFNPSRIVKATYRPFVQQWLYFDRLLNNSVYRIPVIFPTQNTKNRVIQVTGTGSTKDFSCLIHDQIPDLEVISKGQCFPLYWWEPVSESENDIPHGDLFAEQETVIVDGYRRRDAITDKALEHFRSHYGDDSITKEAIFHYVYGALHDPVWREKYAADLKKSLPRIELHEDFWKIESLGRQLAALHLGYETVEPWPLEEIVTSTVPDYRVEKMRFRSKADKSAVVYNHYLTLEGIPQEAHEYVVNGRSPVEWLIDRYQIRVDKETGIVNDPNAWCKEVGDERYIVDLIKRVVRVSVETVRVIQETFAPAEATVD